MREPRLVRRRVSGETPTVKWVGVKAVMVRHVPGRCGISVGWEDKSGMSGRKGEELDLCECYGEGFWGIRLRIPFILMLSPK